MYRFCSDVISEPRYCTSQQSHLQSQILQAKMREAVLKDMAYAEVPPLFCEGDLMLREAMSHKVLRMICSKAFRPVFTQYVLWFWLSPLIYFVCDYVHTICISSIRYRWFMYIYHVIICIIYNIHIHYTNMLYKVNWSTPQTGSSDIFGGDSSQLSVATPKGQQRIPWYIFFLYIHVHIRYTFCMYRWYIDLKYKLIHVLTY